MTGTALSGKHVLVVEDEFLVAMLVEDVLHDAGCIVVGPYARVADALEAAKTATFDCALLDVNVANEMVFPVAYVLEERGIPFVILSGYGPSVLPRDRPYWEVRGKPILPAQLVDCLIGLVKPA